MEENLPPPEDEAEEEAPSAGDLPEGLQDVGQQMEERPEEEIPPGTSPPQVPPKLLPQLSAGEGERLELKEVRDWNNYTTHTEVKGKCMGGD